MPAGTDRLFVICRRSTGSSLQLGIIQAWKSHLRVKRRNQHQRATSSGQNVCFTQTSCKFQWGVENTWKGKGWAEGSQLSECYSWPLFSAHDSLHSNDYETELTVQAHLNLLKRSLWSVGAAARAPLSWPYLNFIKFNHIKHPWKSQTANRSSVTDY